MGMSGCISEAHCTANGECTGQAQNVFPPIDLLWKFSIAKVKNPSLFVHPHRQNYSLMQLE